MNSLRPEDELEILRLYSNREITSSEAKTVLGCDRMELIEKLGRVGLGLPRLPREEVDKMADEVIDEMPVGANAYATQPPRRACLAIAGRSG